VLDGVSDEGMLGGVGVEVKVLLCDVVAEVG
jgi:hypothetical protein